MSRRQVRILHFDSAAVRTRRLELGLTQENLARTVGVTLRTVQRWEDGSSEPHEPQALRLAKAIGVDSDDLYLEEVPAA